LHQLIRKATAEIQDFSYFFHIEYAFDFLFIIGIVLCLVHV